MGDQQEILNTILLTRLNYFSLAGMLELYRKVGSATLILEHKNNLRDILPDASDKLVNAIQTATRLENGLKRNWNTISDTE